MPRRARPAKRRDAGLVLTREQVWQAMGIPAAKAAGPAFASEADRKRAQRALMEQGRRR